jgi:hypothetical protein
VTDKVAEGGKKAAAVVNEPRGKAADALDSGADAVDHEGAQLPKPLNEYATDVKQGLSAAADYVRTHDAREMAGDAANSVSQYPIASLVLIGAVVIGGGLLIATALAQGDAEETSDAETAPSNSLLAVASNGLGPKASETVTRMRDAAFSLALTKAVDSIEDMFPGFREHFDKA